MINKIKLIMLCAITFCLFSGKAHAQWAVIDPSNLAQNILTAVRTGTSASNMLNNFNETVKIYKQGKEYYDALKKVHNLVKDARKVQQTILMVGDISDCYVNGFQRMLQDPYFTASELESIAQGYAILLQESSNVLNDLKEVVNINGLSLTDKDRIDVVNQCYDKILEYRNLVRYYTNKTIGVSYVRAKKAGEQKRILDLYGNPHERYW